MSQHILPDTPITACWVRRSAALLLMRAPRKPCITV